MPDNHTNLPILDDIIKPGDTDKAVHQPSSKVQSSLRSGGETNTPSTARSDAETSAPPATGDQPDTIELLADNQSAIDAIDQTQVPPVTEADGELAIAEPVPDEIHAEMDETRASATNAPDLDALTEEILFNMVPEIEQLLRDRIRQTLSRHFSGDTGSD
jgi:hypothetical protein